MANGINIENLNLKEIADLQVKLAEQAKAVEAATRVDALAQVTKLAAELGFEIHDLVSGKAANVKKVKVVKYRNEIGQTWSGATQGRKPAWVKEILEAGGDLEQYKV
jgi:DNA-binding protein H-NS